MKDCYICCLYVVSVVSLDQMIPSTHSVAASLNTHFFAAAPRFRNSITVSSGELLRSHKRPHSIISVSSSSSGGSSSSTTSHSSASGYGPLINLGFDPADSPQTHHRSTTLNSQCSVGKNTVRLLCALFFNGELGCISI